MTTNAMSGSAIPLAARGENINGGKEQPVCGSAAIFRQMLDSRASLCDVYQSF